MADYHDLARKVVLITGGANGIGRAMVELFADQQSSVFFCDLDEAAAGELTSKLSKVTFHRVDLTVEQEVRDWVSEVGAQATKVDVLINNAAADPRIEFDKMSTEQWDGLFQRNLRAFFLTAQEASRRMPTEGGSIINFSSITAHLSPAAMTAYVATKSGIIGFTQSLARELGKRRIRVNTISPGWIMTDRQLDQFVSNDVKQMLHDSQCVPDLIQPEEVAEVALFLASSVSRAITGQELLVDRGWSNAG